MTGRGGATAVRRESRQRSWLPAVLLAAVPVVALALASWGGALGTPHNDDWSYIRAAQAFAEDGRIALFGWNRMALLGQSVPAGAVLGVTGGGITTLQLVNLLAATASAVLCFALARRFLGLGPSFLATSTLLLFPEFWAEATSFMTEVPALALALASLCCGCAAVRAPAAGRRGVALFLAAIALGLWAVTVREQAVAAPAAVMFGAAVRWWGTRRLVLVGAASLGFVVAVAAFESWRRGLPGGDPFSLQFEPGGTMLATARLVFSMGLMAAPVALAVARWRRPGTWLGIAFSLVGAVVVIQAPGRSLFLGNYLRPQGGYEAVGLGPRPVVVPEPLWALVQVVAVVAAGVLLALATAVFPRVRPWRLRAPDDAAALVLGVFAVLTVAGALAQTLAGQDPYLRYFLAIPPVLAVLVLRSRITVLHGRPSPGVAALVAAALALVAVVLTGSTLRSDRDRWDAAEELVAVGVHPMDIAVGFEWSGYHSAFSAGERIQRGDFVAPWTPRFGDARECFVISLGRLDPPGYVLTAIEDGVHTYRSRGGC